MVFRIEVDINDRVAHVPCEWNDALPFEGSSRNIGVQVGNSHYHWSVLEYVPAMQTWTPVLMWRTPPITKEETESETPYELINKRIAGQMLEWMFGGEVIDESIHPEPTRKDANLRLGRRSEPALTIYVMSTNTVHSKGILYMFSDMPNRTFGLESTDFVSKEKGCYDTFGVDRAACLRFGYSQQKSPVLVLDGGTAMTYSAMDRNGTMFGGGISPGLGARFRALTDYCGHLPLIQPAEFNAIFRKIQANELDPLPIFATNTEIAMTSSIFQEFNAHCRNIIKQFQQEIDRRDSLLGDKREEKDKEKPFVCITGGDGEIMHLLMSKPGTVVPDEPGISYNFDDIIIKHVKHASLYGMGVLLTDKFHLRSQSSVDETMRSILLGQRVAKKFEVPDEDGDYIYRGSIVSIARGESSKDGMEEAIFKIIYDDDDSEELSFREVFECINLFVQAGEKSNLNPQIYKEDWRTARKEKAKQLSAKMLAEYPKALEKVKTILLPKNIDSPEVTILETNKNGVTHKRSLEKVSKEKTSSTQQGATHSPSKKSKAGGGIRAPQSGVRFIGLPVAKFFELDDETGSKANVLYLGKVQSYDSTDRLWQIEYEDGDSEEYDIADLRLQSSVFFQQMGHEEFSSEDQRHLDIITSAFHEREEWTRDDINELAKSFAVCSRAVKV